MIIPKRVKLGLVTPLIALVGMALYPITDAWAHLEPLRFATLDLEPYGYPDGKGARPGIFREINTAIATRAGLPFTDVVMPLN